MHLVTSCFGHVYQPTLCYRSLLLWTTTSCIFHKSSLSMLWFPNSITFYTYLLHSSKKSLIWDVNNRLTSFIFFVYFSILPAPSQQIWDRDDELKAKRVGSALVHSQTSIPPYGQRKGWVPRVEADYAG